MKIPIFFLVFFFFLFIQCSHFPLAAKINFNPATIDSISEIQLIIKDNSESINSGFILEFLDFEFFSSTNSKIKLTKAYSSNGQQAINSKFLVEKNKILIIPNFFNSVLTQIFYFTISNIKTPPNTGIYKFIYTNLKTAQKQIIDFTFIKVDLYSQKSRISSINKEKKTIFNSNYSTEKYAFLNYILKYVKKNIQIKNSTDLSQKNFKNTKSPIKINFLNSENKIFMETNPKIASNNSKIPNKNIKIKTKSFYKHPIDFYAIPSLMTLFILFFTLKYILSYNKSDIKGIIITILSIFERPLILLLCNFSVFKSSFLLICIFFFCALIQIIFSILFIIINNRVSVDHDVVIFFNSHKNLQNYYCYFILLFDYKTIRLFYSNAFNKNPIFNLEYKNISNLHFVYKSLIIMDMTLIIMPLFISSLFIVFNLEKFCFLWFLGIYCCYCFSGIIIFCLVDFYCFNETKYKENCLSGNSNKNIEKIESELNEKYMNCKSIVDTDKIIEEFERKKNMNKDKEIVIEMQNFKNTQNLKNDQINNDEINETNSTFGPNTIENNKINLDSKNSNNFYNSNHIQKFESANSKYIEDSKERKAIILSEISKQIPKKNDYLKKCVLINKAVYKQQKNNIIPENKNMHSVDKNSKNDNINDLMNHNLYEFSSRDNENEYFDKSINTTKANENTMSKMENKIKNGDITKSFCDLLNESDYSKGDLGDSFIMYDIKKTQLEINKEKHEYNDENNINKDNDNNIENNKAIENQSCINDVTNHIKKFENSSIKINSEHKINENKLVEEKYQKQKNVLKSSIIASESLIYIYENENNEDNDSIANNKNLNKFTNSDNQDVHLGDFVGSSIFKNSVNSMGSLVNSLTD